MSDYPITWAKVTTELRAANEEKAWTRSILDNVPNYIELQPKVLKLIDLARDYEELRIAQLNKGIPIDLTEESGVSVMDVLSNQDPVGVKARKMTAKKLARGLYSRIMPDFGGDVEKFRVVREAVKEGDLETLYYMRMSLLPETCTEKSADLLLKAICIRRRAFQGSRTFKLAALYISNRTRFFEKCSAVLDDKIVNLQLMLTGFNPDTQMGDTDASDQP